MDKRKFALGLAGIGVAAVGAGVAWFGYRRGWIKREDFLRVKDGIAKRLNMLDLDVN